MMETGAVYDVVGLSVNTPKEVKVKSLSDKSTLKICGASIRKYSSQNDSISVLEYLAISLRVGIL